MTRSKLPLIALALSASLALACKSDKASGPPPAVPAHGSPLSADFVKFVDGDDRRAVEVRLYNHGDVAARTYMILAKYMDKDGATMKVKAGTPFEKDHDFTSMSGGRYTVEPKKSKTLTVDMLSIPADAVSAEFAITKVDGPDNKNIWQMERWSDWPEALNK